MLSNSARSRSDRVKGQNQDRDAMLRRSLMLRLTRFAHSLSMTVEECSVILSQAIIAMATVHYEEDIECIVMKIRNTKHTDGTKHSKGISFLFP
jgi:hypothetical protein